jgi:hypothetical protein
MTFFGQFFDHGLDLITKGDNGTVFIPLQPDDPLITHGPDGIPDSGDEVPAHLAFMAVTRSTAYQAPGADGIMGTADDTFHEGRNTTTPYVDQNQTYTSHASHQVFLREYALDGAGRPVSTGRLLNSPNGDGLATWADVKAQARDMLGIELTDGDVLNVPLLRTDAYGKFIPDANGYAQVIVGLGADGIPNTDDDIVVSGTPGAPVNTFDAGAIRTGHAFLDDIAHAANPLNSQTISRLVTRFRPLINSCGMASGCSRPRDLPPRCSISIWCSKSLRARFSPISTPSCSTRSPTSTRRSLPNSPTRFTALATRC